MRIYTYKTSNRSALQPEYLNQQVDSDDSDLHLCTIAAIKKSFVYFLQNTTLHGLKYTVERKITTVERVFFGLSFILVTILGIFFTNQLYDRWASNPIIITSNAKPMLVSEVPFPAITVCNLNLAQKSKVQQINENTLNYSLLMSLCDQTNHESDFVGNWKSFKAVLQEVAPPCKEMLLFCGFEGKEEDCLNIFKSTLTDGGLCCTFNALDKRYTLLNSTDESFSSNTDNPYVPIDWTPELGYPKNLPEFFYPRFSGSYGSSMGLTLILNASSTEYYCTKSNSFGFKVLVHNPAEKAKVSNFGFTIMTGTTSHISLEPIYQDASPALRSFDKSTRHCLFSDEGDLQYYRTYSQKSCEVECEAKIIQDMCNCVLYYLPHVDPNSRICGPKDTICTKRIMNQIQSSSTNLSCSSCLPGCFELYYKATLTLSSLVYGQFLINNNLPNYIHSQEDLNDVTFVHFYYTSNTLRSTTKSLLFGLTDFISTTGGLLSLLMGFSIFSVIEIIFYITIRPYCASHKIYQSQHKKEQQFKGITSSKRKFSKSEFMWEKSENIARRRFRKSLNAILPYRKKIEDDTNQLFPYLE